MATVRDYFETDFTRDVVGRNTFDFAREDGRLVPVPVQLHFDFDANAVFVAFYVPAVPDAPGFIQGICGHVDRALAIGEGRGIRAGRHGERQVPSTDLQFAGRVFVYAEDDLSDAEIDTLVASVRPQGVYLRVRGPRYARARSAFEKPLAFISYDSGDRDTVAGPLAHALAQIRCHAWFDQYSMRAGDPLERVIRKGLEECERCIVILSPRYLENQRWARKEFDAIAEREAREDRALIIPVRVGVTTDEVAAFSPALAHRRSLDWDPLRLPDIASEISVTLLAIGRPHERSPQDGPP